MHAEGLVATRWGYFAKWNGRHLEAENLVQDALKASFGLCPEKTGKAQGLESPAHQPDTDMITEGVGACGPSRQETLGLPRNKKKAHATL